VRLRSVHILPLIHPSIWGHCRGRIEWRANACSSGQTKTFLIQLNSGAYNLTHLINEIALNGSMARSGSLVTIPEPSAFALLCGLLAFAAVMTRRRRD